MQLWTGTQGRLVLVTLSHRLQYFTWADKAGGSYRKPESKEDPLLEILRIEKEKEKEKLGKA